VRTDAGRASWARTVASNWSSQGTARSSGREIASIVSISIDSHKRWPFADRHPGICWPIVCPSGPLQLATRKSPVRSRFRNQSILRRRKSHPMWSTSQKPSAAHRRSAPWASRPTQPRSIPTSGSTTPWSQSAWAPLCSRSSTWCWFDQRLRRDSKLSPRVRIGLSKSW